MTSNLRTLADPFLQDVAMPHTAVLNVLGLPIQFASNECWLMQLAHDAFAGLPNRDRKRVSSDTPLVRMIANDDLPINAIDIPPSPRTYGDDALLVTALTQADIACVNRDAEQAFITVSPAMARFPYNVRYELIEFAAYRLATHCLGGVGMHAACVAKGNASLLLFGESGAGKSTLVLALMQQGWDLIGEDAVFALPEHECTLVGASNFVHLTDDAPALINIQDLQPRQIQRRSGRVKYEVDARKLTQQSRVAAPLGHLVFLESTDVGSGRQLRKLDLDHVQQLLSALQPFAARQPKWPQVQSALLAQPAWRLGRARVQDSVALLMELVDGYSMQPTTTE